MCGEKCSRLPVTFRHDGSPPRVRGKEFANIGEQAVKGITPACAGKSHAGVCGDLVEEDHPRVCGEKMCIVLFSVFHLGSPPRVRGKVDFYYFYTPDRRITPACAGKSLYGSLIGRGAQDHPRVCGEKRFLLILHSRSGGSPPRVRGKGQKESQRQEMQGITPACAGKSYTRCPVLSLSEDHPRVCGEKSMSAILRKSL